MSHQINIALQFGHRVEVVTLDETDALGLQFWVVPSFRHRGNIAVAAARSLR